MTESHQELGSPIDLYGQRKFVIYWLFYEILQRDIPISSLKYLCKGEGTIWLGQALARSWQFVGALLSVCPIKLLSPSELASANSGVRRLAPNGALQGDKRTQCQYCVVVVSVLRAFASRNGYASTQRTVRNLLDV